MWRRRWGGRVWVGQAWAGGHHFHTRPMGQGSVTCPSEMSGSLGNRIPGRAVAAQQQLHTVDGDAQISGGWYTLPPRSTHPSRTGMNTYKEEYKAKVLACRRCRVNVLPPFLLKQGKPPSSCLMAPFGSEDPRGEAALAQALATGRPLTLGRLSQTQPCRSSRLSPAVAPHQHTSPGDASVPAANPWPWSLARLVCLLNSKFATLESGRFRTGWPWRGLAAS